MSDSKSNRRVLIIDDNEAIHDDIRKVLNGDSTTDELTAATARLLGKPETLAFESMQFDIESSFQGQEGLQTAEKALKDSRPFAVAFVDMRMPPGWDGLETIERLWKVDPSLQVVICTAYSDYTWQEITTRLGTSDRLLILKKPFDPIEARQLSYTLTEKWNLGVQAQARLNELMSVNRRLEDEVIRRRKVEQRLSHEALHDILTDLPNRSLLIDRVEQCIQRSKVDDDYHYAILFLDLDNFKVVNDSLGHKAGDRLLVEIARRLVQCLRSLDYVSRPTEHTAARLGGDEFVVLLDGIRRQEDAIQVADRIREFLAVGIDLDGHDVRPTTSIGIASSDIAYEQPEEILRDADTALYRAKNQGKECYVVFDKKMRHEAMARLQIESELRRAIDEHQLFLHYQPIVALMNGDIESFEALVRWVHPEKGPIAPAEFIPIAEQAGLIVALGKWVLREACLQTQAWRKKYPQLAQLSISVNFSTKQFARADFIPQLDRILHETGLDKKHLNIELTETVLMEQAGLHSSSLEELRARNMALHMDDFGTGYSSLSYLNNLPIAAIKIDRSFVKVMTTSKEHAATIRAVIELAHARGLKVIAEGIETDKQLAMLKALKCDLGQGYFFSRPVDAVSVDKMLALGVKNLLSA